MILGYIYSNETGLKQKRFEKIKRNRYPKQDIVKYTEKYIVFDFALGLIVDITAIACIVSTTDNKINSTFWQERYAYK